MFARCLSGQLVKVAAAPAAVATAAAAKAARRKLRERASETYSRVPLVKAQDMLVQAVRSTELSVRASHQAPPHRLGDMNGQAHVLQIGKLVAGVAAAVAARS